MEKTNINQNVMPNIMLFPRLEAIIGGVGKLISHLVSFCPLSAPDHMSDHYRGAAATLDSHLYDPKYEQYCNLGREE